MLLFFFLFGLTEIIFGVAVAALPNTDAVGAAGAAAPRPGLVAPPLPLLKALVRVLILSL